jgi:hypothetical protein
VGGAEQLLANGRQPVGRRGHGKKPFGATEPPDPPAPFPKREGGEY